MRAWAGTALGLSIIGVGLALPAGAVDRVIGGRKLLMRVAPSGVEKLVFASPISSRDSDVPIAPGFQGPDDPATGSPGGAIIELFTLGNPVPAVLSVPPGLGKPGWRAEPDFFKFANRSAPDGFSDVRVMVMRGGSGAKLKVVARRTAAALTGGLGGVGIRITTGSLRQCAFFSPLSGTVVHDDPGTFLAKKARGFIPDCSEPSMIGMPTTTSTTSTSTSTTTSTTTTTIALGFVRALDPVVLTGAEMPSLLGVVPGDVVAFRWDGGWTQVPLQVDERAMIDFTNVYAGLSEYGGGIVVLDYADAGTHTGADPDPSLDADDEVVFMGRDLGLAAPGGPEPAGVVAGSGVQVLVSDPVDGGTGYVYLFVQNGSLDPGAGQQYVDYAFQLLSGDYLTTYDVDNGPNPEDTVVTTSHYQTHFTDRWIRDELRLLPGTSSGIDVLDRHGSGVQVFDACFEDEDLWSDLEGAFVTNRVGPVRAIRSYVGAASGPLTQRRHRFYEGREDVESILRVHGIAGPYDRFDYEPATAGMWYANAANPSGVVIDGVPDTLAGGPPDWEMVSGAHGSVVHVHDTFADFSPVILLTYTDDFSVFPCTGDFVAFGVHGLFAPFNLPNTDPRTSPFNSLTQRRIMYLDGPGLSAPDAEQRATWARMPLAASVAAWP